MKILYIAPLVAGFQDILEGNPNAKGLPSFIFPLKKLLDDGNDVDMVLVSNYVNEINIKVTWIANKNIIANINNDFANSTGIKRCILKMKSFFQLYKVLSNALRNGDYDFVYCHGTAAYLGNVLANWYKVRCGYRVYGVANLARDIRKKGKLYSILKYPVYYGIFNSKKDFIVITDDGTHGDYAFRSYNPNANFPMYHCVNGVDKTFKYKPQLDFVKRNGCKDGKYIFHAARISRIKRQDRVIEVLHRLHLLGRRIHLFLAGHISDEKYYSELLSLIENYGLQQYVHYLGPVERSTMQSLAHDAIATILLGDCSNQGNVFWECAIAETVIITYPEISLQKYIKNKENAFFVNNVDEAKNIVMSILNGEYDVEKIALRLKDTINDELPTWEERTQFETELILGNCDV